MKTGEARALLEDRVDTLRATPYGELVAQWLHQPDCEQVEGSGGTVYQIEIGAIWDDETLGHVRVLASVDDGGWRALRPLSIDFIVAPDGTFVGE